MTQRNAFARWAFMVLTIAALGLSSACKKHNPIEPGPTSPEYITSIPAPDPAHLDQAFLRYHRWNGAVIFDQSTPASAFRLSWFDGGQRRAIDCPVENLNWDAASGTLTCLLAFDKPTDPTLPDSRLPVDTEIQIWVTDFALFNGGQGSSNQGKDIFINGTLLPEPRLMGVQPWPVGVFKLHPDGTPYW